MGWVVPLCTARSLQPRLQATACRPAVQQCRVQGKTGAAVLSMRYGSAPRSMPSSTSRYFSRSSSTVHTTIQQPDADSMQQVDSSSKRISEYGCPSVSQQPKQLQHSALPAHPHREGHRALVSHRMIVRVTTAHSYRACALHAQPTNFLFRRLVVCSINCCSN